MSSSSQKKIFSYSALTAWQWSVCAQLRLPRVISAWETFPNSTGFVAAVMSSLHTLPHKGRLSQEFTYVKLMVPRQHWTKTLSGDLQRITAVCILRQVAWPLLRPGHPRCSPPQVLGRPASYTVPNKWDAINQWEKCCFVQDLRKSNNALTWRRFGVFDINLL